MTYMRDHYDKRFTPVVLRYLKDGDAYDRSKAVELSVQHDIKEALPGIRNCITEDKDSSVRGDCRIAYWKMAGVMSSDFTPEDAKHMENYLNNPVVINVTSKMKDSDPEKQEYLEQKNALAEYQAAKSR